MMRLVRYGLMYGNLYEVSSEALVNRYNRALNHLIGKETKLTEFHIDICGYSPEVADELDDQLYLKCYSRKVKMDHLPSKSSATLPATFQ